jgi:uncharacterized protein
MFAFGHATWKSAVRGAVALVLALIAAGTALAQNWEAGTDGLAPIPPLRARVTDLTNTLSVSEQQALEAKLAAWERDTGAQMVVLVVPSTKPEPIETYSIRVAEAWKIGRKGQDNGVLFLVAKDDHKMRLEVGYGLEGVLTDVTSRRIIAEDVAPLFRQNQFAAGINAGADRVISVVGKGEPLPAKPAQQTRRPGGGFDFGTMLIVLLVVVPVIGGILSRIFGKVGGSTVGAGIVGGAAWLIGGSLIIAGVAAIVGFFIMLLFGGAGGIGRSGGGWIPIGGGGWGGGGGLGGGGGFGGGGGGGFGGGGASGGW